MSNDSKAGRTRMMIDPQPSNWRPYAADQLRRAERAEAGLEATKDALRHALLTGIGERTRAESAEADRDRLREVIRAQVGPLSDLVSVLEEECDTTEVVCHGRDLTEDGECALAADLIAIFYALQGALFAKMLPAPDMGVIDVDMTGLNGDVL